MAKLTITEAARQFSVGRSTLYRHIQSGRITTMREFGVVVIDSAELARVYPSRDKRDDTTKRTVTQPQESHDERAAIYLIAARNEIKFLNQQIEFLKEQLIEKDKQLNTALRLLPKPNE